MKHYKAVMHVRVHVVDLARFLARHFPRTALVFVQSICGINEKQHVDPSRIPVMASNDMGGTSVKNILHWKQLLDTGKVRQFDYGEEKNMLVYNQSTPLPYAIESLKERLSQVHIQLFFGDKDIFTTQPTIAKVMALMPDVNSTTFGI